MADNEDRDGLNAFLENAPALEAEEEGEEQEIETPEDGEDEFSIELEGEEVEEEPPLVKTLRQEIRDRDRELADYRKAQVAKIEVGEKPTLEGCDYDAELFETKLDEWKERKRQADNQEADAAKQAEVRNQEFQRNAIRYKAKLEALPIPAEQKEAAEKTVIAALPELLQSAIIQYAEDPAKVVVALAKHPQKLQQIAAEPDMVRALFMLRDMERNLKVVTRKRPPAPENETILRGSAPTSKTADKREIELEKKAAATGDYDELFKYRQAKKRKAA